MAAQNSNGNCPASSSGAGGSGACISRNDTVIPYDQFRAALELVVSSNDPRNFLANFQKIGEGSTGIVFSVTDLRTNAKRALKKMNLYNQQRRELLFNEVVIMREHHHENIVKMLDSFVVHDELWILMEYIDGGTLTEVVTQAR